ncbi:lipoprotein [uncultured Paraglaciecola sp.]|uniref:LPS translocon maturation chaperone LptM n=1 Tax=uncultured Paraglaciecola sp. TaxID=1765024 RepID=UPI002595F4A6|nr:lipoprotein [uncultured Paraglaciecola sp.]
MTSLPAIYFAVVVMLKILKIASQLMLLLCLLGLSACGQKKALYLPEEPKSNQAEMTTTEATESPATGAN